MSNIVLAFDIERSGATNKHQTIAIGASVVDQDLQELDRLFLPGYFTGESLPKIAIRVDTVTTFEHRYWDTFWVNHQDILKSLEYKGPLSKQSREEEMITLFQQFRAKWELKAQDIGRPLQLVSDNTVYDGGFINQMIYDHLDSVLPIPYAAGLFQEVENSDKDKYKVQKYSNFYNISDIQRGFLFAIDPTYIGWERSYRLTELYDVPKSPYDIKHDHNPANDAYTIGYDMQVINNIRNNTYKKK